MPVGTIIHNVEIKPGHGAQMMRSAGTSATVLSKDGNLVQLKLPSGEISLANIGNQLDKINAKYRFLFDRLRERLKNANRCLIIFEGLLPATELEKYRVNTACNELLYPKITNGFDRELVQILKDCYKVETTLASFQLGAPRIEQQQAILHISAPILTYVFDDDAESYQRPWASYDMLFSQLCAALSKGDLEKFASIK
jgi:hypothetical protein